MARVVLMWCVDRSAARIPRKEETKKVAVMHFKPKPTLLVIGVDWSETSKANLEGRSDGIEVTKAASVTRATDLMRLMSFDVVVVGEVVNARPFGSKESSARVSGLEFAKLLKKQWPWQKWVYAASRILQVEEIQARSLGATAVLEAGENETNGETNKDLVTQLIAIAHAVATRKSEVDGRDVGGRELGGRQDRKQMIQDQRQLRQGA